MVDELRHVLERAQQQSEEALRNLALRVGAWLAEQEEERDWDAIIASPAGQAALARLASEARADIAQGKTRGLDDLL